MRGSALMVALAAGLAMGGKHPVVSIYSTFLQRAFDQVLTEAVALGGAVTLGGDVQRIAVLEGQGQHPLRRALTDHLRDDQERVARSMEATEQANAVGLQTIVELLVQTGA